MKRIFTIVMLACFGMNLAAQTVWKNEVLSYGLYIGPVKAGEAELTTKKTDWKGQDAVMMQLVARTTKAAEKIFSLNDTLTTFVRPQDSAPIHFQKHCIEEDDIVYENDDFIYQKDGKWKGILSKTYRDGHVKEKTVMSASPIYDMISVVGYARAMDTGSLRDGQRMDFKLADAAEVLDESLVFMGRETLKMNGRKYSCLKFRLVEPYYDKGKKKDRDIMTIFVSDDAAHTIVEMDIKFKVGTAKAKLL
ncbi:MAG: DUF3108 domain-containing protein [Bacteroidaceae bacterium]|nr:DUF3108 domain-containing protein [Bacteroidaceae bacterium]